MKVIQTQENLELLIAAYWKRRFVKTAATEDFKRNPFWRGLGNLLTGTARTIAGTFWNAVITPINVVLPLPAADMWDDAWEALKHTVKGLGEMAYGFAQMGYAGAQKLRDLAFVGSKQIRDEAMDALSQSGKPVDPKMEKAIEQGANNVKNELLNFSTYVAQNAPMVA